MELKDCSSTALPKQKSRKTNSGSNARGDQFLAETAPLHKWSHGERVKIRTLSFTITDGSAVINKKLIDLQSTAKYGMHVIKLQESGAYNCIDRPHQRHELLVGDRVHAIFEVEPSEFSARNNADLVNRFDRLYTVGNLEKDKTAKLAADSSWGPKFRQCVKDLCLDSKEAKLTCESFDCFQIQYPEDAPSAWIGSPASKWRDLSIRPIPSNPSAPRATLRALDMRNEFKTSPVMVCRRASDADDRRYVLPALPETVVHGGDLMLFLCDGGPGAKHHFQLDPKVWKGTFERLTSALWLEEHLPLALDALPGLPLSPPPSEAKRAKWADCVEEDAE